MNHRHSLPLEPAPQLDKQRLSLRRDRTPEVEEDFESGSTRLIEELEAASSHAVHVAGLFDSERCGQLLPSDGHVKRIGLDVEELARRAESAELPVNFNRRCAVRHQNPHRTECLEALKQFLPPANIEFHDPIRWECSNDFDLWYAEITGQLQCHLPRVLLNGCSDAVQQYGLLTCSARRSSLIVVWFLT